MYDLAYEIDDALLMPQPDLHAWEPEIETVDGYDGDGAPIKRKFRTCVLTTQRPITLGECNWFGFDDGSTHTATLPAPNTTADWTAYTTVYCIVSHGGIERALATDKIEMQIRMAQA